MDPWNVIKMYVCTCFATRGLLALLTDVSGGRIRMTRSRLTVGLITPHRTCLTITKTHKGGQGQIRAVVPLMMMMTFTNICYCATTRRHRHMSEEEGGKEKGDKRKRMRTRK
jgi:hypothetical protein